MKILCITLLILSFTSIVAQDTVSESDTMEWNTLEGKGYSINYPSDWEVNQEGLMGTSFYLFSPIADEKDFFRENINLIIQDISAYDINLDQFVELSEKQLVTMMQDTKVISSERITGEKEYHSMIFTAKQGIYDLQFQQHSWIIDKSAYILTFTAEASTYSSYEKIGASIMGTIRTK